MNVADRLNATKKLTTIAYGHAKTKKTTWACSAVKSGMNVIYGDAENSVAILGSVLTPEEQAKILYLDLADEPNRAVSSWFAAALVRGKPFIWDLEEKRIIQSRNKLHDCMLIDIRKLTPNDLFVFDSYTALVASLNLQFATENNIDLGSAAKTEWEGFGWTGRLAAQFLSTLTSLKCSVTVIGHVKTYEKYTKSPNSSEAVLTSVKIQPLSTSNPHGETITKLFDNALYFKALGTGVMIDTRTSNEVDCGSRLLPPKLYNYNDLPFEKLAKLNSLGGYSKQEAFVGVSKDMPDEEYVELYSVWSGKAVTKPATNNGGVITPKTAVKFGK